MTRQSRSRVPPEPPVDEALVAEVARAMLGRAAAVEPERVTAERRVFPALSRAYFADPERALARRDRGGGHLTFGLPGVEVLLTPVLLAASAELLAYLTARGAAVTRVGVRRLLGAADADPDAPAPGPSADSAAVPRGRPPSDGGHLGPSPEQWAAMRAIVATMLVRHAELPRERAELIAAAVVGEGVTAGAADTAGAAGTAGAADTGRTAGTANDQRPPE